jgi:hypothetical protein
MRRFVACQKSPERVLPNSLSPSKQGKLDNNLKNARIVLIKLGNARMEFSLETVRIPSLTRGACPFMLSSSSPSFSSTTSALSAPDTQTVLCSSSRVDQGCQELVGSRSSLDESQNDYICHSFLEKESFKKLLAFAPRQSCS